MSRTMGMTTMMIKLVQLLIVGLFMKLTFTHGEIMSTSKIGRLTLWTRKASHGSTSILIGADWTRLTSHI